MLFQPTGGSLGCLISKWVSFYGLSVVLKSESIPFRSCTFKLHHDMSVYGQLQDPQSFLFRPA